MNFYRTPPALSIWLVEADVLGPLAPLLMGSLLEARDEEHAIELFTEKMTEAGFTLLSAVRAARADSKCVESHCTRPAAPMSEGYCAYHFEQVSNTFGT